jgi:hypothetical protein
MITPASEPKPMTHDDLVRRAVWWLSESQDCQIVLSEQGGGGVGEMPDAIGWHNGISILVECKASIENLKADFKKPWRLYPDLGMGNYRWYLVPKELEEDAKRVLEGPKDRWTPLHWNYHNSWGLLVAHPTQIRISKKITGWKDEEWAAKEKRLSPLGKENEYKLLISKLGHIAFHIGKLQLCDFLRKHRTEMLLTLQLCEHCGYDPCVCVKGNNDSPSI